MFRLLKIFVLIVFIQISSANQLQDNFTISFPISVPAGKTFQVSIITSSEYFNADELQLFITTTPGTNLKSAVVNSIYGSSRIEIENLNLDDFESAAGKKLSINLNDSSITGQSFFQILIDLVSGREEKGQLKFLGRLIKDEQTSGYLVSNDGKLKNDSGNFYSFEVKYYEPINIIGQCLKFNPSSSLTIPADYNPANNLFTEFWIKLDKSPLTFLSIKNSASGRYEFQLSTNEFQMLSAESKYNASKKIISEFISNKVWYHVSVLCEFKEKLMLFYIDGNLFGEFVIGENINSTDLQFEFSNTSSGSFLLDQFRLIDLTGDPDCLFRYKNFTGNYCENSRKLLQINFTEDEINHLRTNGILSAENLIFVRSDAPLHPVVPELNVILSNNYFEIDFTAVENKNVTQYIIERSTGKNEFTPVKKFVIENNDSRNFSCLVERTDESELVYFRLRQINKDGTELYSGQVKIGQGTIEDILLGQNYPNPFNPSTQIEFELLQDGEVQVKVFNLGGQEIATLHEGFLAKGIHQLKFDGNELPSGIYLLRVSTANFTQARKMILAK